jgi:hypothetical protein
MFVPVTLSLHLNHRAMMNQSVKDGSGERFINKDAVPFRDTSVGRDDD